MGITGLLPFLEKASKKCNINEFKGSTVAVDTYCWLHKGAFACADKLARGEKTNLHINYCMKYVNMLLANSIKPILVFDGRHLPAKAMTEAKRRESRQQAKKRAAELLRLGQIEEARSYMRRSVDITHEMALELIKECRKRNVDCIVAPYEADAQMAYLNKLNIAQIIITEDSDLILFGCKKILYKMDLNGYGVLVDSSMLPLVMKCPLERYSFDKFRKMCIMSGCDYLASLPGIGLVKARQFINATQDPDIRNALRKMPSFFKKSSMVVSDEYREKFVQAEATFKHQLVYDPLQRKLLPLTDIEEEGTNPEDCINAGAILDDKIAFQLALGNIDPFSLAKMDDWHPDNKDNKVGGGKTNGWSQNSIAPHQSIWSRGYSEHINPKSPKKDKKFQAAISMPTTRPLTCKIVNPRVSQKVDTGLTIDHLTAMYCLEPPIKKQKINNEDSQDNNIHVFESQVFTSKNPFSKKNPLEEKLNLQQKHSLNSNVSPNKENSPDDETTTSPILVNKNRSFKKTIENEPKLLKLSKFQRTIVDENNVVGSRFFNSFSDNKDINEETAPNEESGLNISGIAALQVVDEVISKSEISTKCNLSEILDEAGSSGDSLVRDRTLSSANFSWKSLGTSNPSTSSCSDSEGIFSMKSDITFDETRSESHKFSEEFCIQNTYALKDLISPNATQDSGISDMTETEPIANVNKYVSNSQHLPRKQSCLEVPKKKNPTCRKPGLHKRNSVASLPPGQQTLLNLFGFQKKSQLKH